MARIITLLRELIIKQSHLLFCITLLTSLRYASSAPLADGLVSSSEPVAPPLLPLAYHASGASSGLFLGEYGYDHVDQLSLPLWNLGFYLTIQKRVYGYRHGAFWGFGMFVDAPPFFGFGVVREGIGFNILADLLAMHNLREGQQSSGSGLKSPSSAPD